MMRLPHLLLISSSGSGLKGQSEVINTLLNWGEKYLQLSLNSMLAGRVNSAFSAPSWDLIKTKESSERWRNALSRAERVGSDRRTPGLYLLSCCSPLIMGFTMPLSISSLPELCTGRTNGQCSFVKHYLSEFVPSNSIANGHIYIYLTNE